MKKIISRKRYKFINILNIWLKSKQDIKIQSYQKYEMLIKNYISNEYLSDIPIQKLVKNDLILFFQKLQNNDLSISSQKTLLCIIKSAVNYAYKNKYCYYIDLTDIKLKVENKTIFILSKEEQNILEVVLKEKTNIRKICLLLCLYTGIRVGEASGLKWEDIDFSNKSLIIKRTIIRVKNQNNTTKTILIESTPKSATSKRIIPIPNFIIELLSKFKQNDNYYLLSNSEKLYDPRYLESFYNRILKKCNIKNNKFHTLRHTFATRPIESKMDIKTLSEILGHSSIEITLKLYVHPTYDMKKKSIESLVQYMTI